MNENYPNEKRQRHFDWKNDLLNSRDLSQLTIRGFGLVLGWQEDWREKHELPPGREAVRQWWIACAKTKERPEWHQEKKMHQEKKIDD